MAEDYKELVKQALREGANPRGFSAPHAAAYAELVEEFDGDAEALIASLR